MPIAPSRARSARFTRHARLKMTDRAVSREDVLAALCDPHVSEPSYGGCTRYTRGPLCVVADVSGEAPVVVTVLLRERRQWSDADVRARVA